ncbi:hypothetical protein B0H14DRAFT_2257498, partial [Mycena olivaceomarginata]
VLTKHDKEEQGFGLQNFKYSPAFDEFTQILNLQSPAAYRIFGETFPTRTARSWRQQEARQPRFPLEICDRTYELTIEHLKGLGWSGPVGMSCDDTKLNAAFRLYWDSEKKKHMLVGATDGPHEVADPDSVRKVIDSAKLIKASKLRVFCITPQTPGMVPIILHAMPIGSKDWGAEHLAPYSETLLRGLITRKVQVVSYACDG